MKNLQNIDKKLKIAILTAANDWFVPYAEELHKRITNSVLCYHHSKLEGDLDIVFILNYYEIIPQSVLNSNKCNVVVHASALPKGKGWAPMFWQILEGKNIIPFTMFEASGQVDEGGIYLQKNLVLTGYELNKELRYKQAHFVMNLCVDFLIAYKGEKHTKDQRGEGTFYSKRTEDDSELDINKTILEQFNLLRIVDNEKYPAFFYIDAKKYKIRIEEFN